MTVPKLFEQAESQRGCMDGMMGAIDGLFVEVTAPSNSECLNQLSFYSGAKKSHGINVQAIATANYRFSGVMANHPEATNDFSAFISSSLPDATAALPDGIYIVGDAAYPLSQKLLTPYAGKELSEEYDVFNSHLGQVRIKVEQSFGVLVQTWGILWKPIRVLHVGRADVITALFRLHNFFQDVKWWNVSRSKRKTQVRKHYVRQLGTINAFLPSSRPEGPPRVRGGAKHQRERHLADP